MEKKPLNEIPSEVLAAFLDGNATPEETIGVLDAMTADTGVAELIRVSSAVDAECMGSSGGIPMTAIAAACPEGSYCSLECEKKILHKFNIEFDEQKLLQDAVANGWQKEKGTALHNIGRTLEANGLVVTRRYECTPGDIVFALEAGHGVIAAVDGGELLGNRIVERAEDFFNGPCPDHTVVVLSCDLQQGDVTLYDPNSLCDEDTYPIELFVDAWDDSRNYLVTINKCNDMKEYNPKPIDLSDVQLDDDLNELREAIAENAHDVWALERKAQGWSYGPQRNDDKKENPCMVPYSLLPESEKTFDREMAMNTLKLVKKLGYDLVRREETPLYKELLDRIRNTNSGFYCPRCKKNGVMSPVFVHDIFCRKCGCELGIDWNLYKEEQ